MADDQKKNAAAALTPEARLEQARIAYAQMKTHMVMAILFGLCGMGIFAVVYDRYLAADPFAAMRDISTLLALVAPFLPALIFTFFYRKQEKRYLELIRPE
jgi:hypothetical protein